MTTPSAVSAAGPAGAVGATKVQGAALVVGAVFVLVGILGFVPGVTDYGDGMKATGHDSRTPDTVSVSGR